MNADVHALAGPYALDALPPDERATFEAHLASCANCQTDVEEFRLTGARLGGAVAEQPPPGLKGKVLAEIRQTRQLSPPVVPIKRRGASRRTWLVAAAALVLAGAAGVTVVQVRDAQQAERERDAVAAVLAAPDARTYRGAVRGGGSVTLVASTDENAAVVVLDRLPAAPRGKDYQLWMIHGTRPVSAGVAAHDEPGRVLRIVDESVDGASGFGLTIEPAGGSDQPTSPTIAEVPLTTG
jgi:anti-sigma-K factor RskA